MFVGSMLMSTGAMTAIAAEPEMKAQTATIYNQMSDGTFQKLHVDYTVEAYATDAEESDAAFNAAVRALLAEENKSLMSFNQIKSGGTKLASDTLDIPENDGSQLSGAVLGCGKMPFRPSYIAFSFTNIDPSITTINIGLENRGQPKAEIYKTNLGVSEDAVITFMNDTVYHELLQLNKDDNLVARFSSNTGSGKMRVKAYAYE